MLVLSRKREQALLIGENVRVKILEINQNRVKIGIEAPDDVRILREEVLERDTAH